MNARRAALAVALCAALTVPVAAPGTGSAVQAWLSRQVQNDVALLSDALTGPATAAATASAPSDHASGREGLAPSSVPPADAASPAVAGQPAPSAPVTATADGADPPAAPSETAGPDVALGALGSREGSESYRFTREENGHPARWSACEPVRVLFNTDNAPEGAVRDMEHAIAMTARATGLDIRVVGQTDAESVRNWGRTRLDGHDGWPPVLVSWGAPGPALNRGASASVEPIWENNRDGVPVMVSGQLRVNVEHDHYYEPGLGGRLSRVALYTHEWGHVVGLDHVDDSRQLMHGTMGSAADLGAGDLTGLAAAGQAGCVHVPSAPWQ